MRLLKERCSLIAGFLATSVLIGRSAALVDKWTPEDFDWSGPPHMRTADVASGIWMNESSISDTTLAKSLVVNNHITTQIGTERFVGVVAFLGLAFRLGTLALAGVTLKDTIDTCKQTAGGDATKMECAKGVVATILHWGVLIQRARRSSVRQNASSSRIHSLTTLWNWNWSPSFIVAWMTSRCKAKRSTTTQFVIYCAACLTSTSPNLCSWAMLMMTIALHDGTVACTTRIDGIGFKGTVNATYFSLAPTGSSMHLLGRAQQIERVRRMTKREEVYDHELIMGGAVEARFVTEASQADPAVLSADTGQLFDTFEPEIECFIDGDFPDSSVLDVQMYDQTNKATFGFGSIGIYGSEEDAASIETMEPEGMPLPSCG